MSDEHIPSAFRVSCDFCARAIDSRSEGVHQYTTGWVKVRSGGGGHGISLAKRQNRWACSYCIGRATRGFIKQESML